MISSNLGLTEVCTGQNKQISEQMTSGIKFRPRRVFLCQFLSAMECFLVISSKKTEEVYFSRQKHPQKKVKYNKPNIIIEWTKNPLHNHFISNSKSRSIPKYTCTLYHSLITSVFSIQFGFLPKWVFRENSVGFSK